MWYSIFLIFIFGIKSFGIKISKSKNFDVGGDRTLDRWIVGLPTKICTGNRLRTSVVKLRVTRYWMIRFDYSKNKSCKLRWDLSIGIKILAIRSNLVFTLRSLPVHWVFDEVRSHLVEGLLLSNKDIRPIFANPHSQLPAGLFCRDRSIPDISVLLGIIFFQILVPAEHILNSETAI